MLRAELTSIHTEAIDAPPWLCSDQCAVVLVSQTQHYIWRKVDAVPHGFKWHNVSSRAFAVLGKIKTTFYKCPNLTFMENKAKMIRKKLSKTSKNQERNK